MISITDRRSSIGTCPQEVVPLSAEGLARHPHLSDLAGHIAESIVGAYLHTFSGLALSCFPERDDEPEVEFVLTLGPPRKVYNAPSRWAPGGSKAGARWDCTPCAPPDALTDI
jgi:hypothetical protein